MVLPHALPRGDAGSDADPQRPAAISTLSRGDGTHSGNPGVRLAVAAGEKQHVSWAVQRDDGGRGFGFTGGHFHNGWINDNQRKLVLNAIAWTAQLEVPANGVQSTVTKDDLAANLDPKQPRGQKPADKPRQVQRRQRASRSSTRRRSCAGQWRSKPISPARRNSISS